MESSQGPVQRGAWAGLPASALTALPACPACYPAYAGLLSSLGLGSLSGVGAQAILTAVFLVAPASASNATLALNSGANFRRFLMAPSPIL